MRAVATLSRPSLIASGVFFLQFERRARVIVNIENIRPMTDLEAMPD